MEEDNKIKGALQQSLDRNSKTIRADRAEQIADDTRLEYRRKIEDLQRDIKKLQRTNAALLDMSPDNTTSIISSKNFEPVDFVETRAQNSIEIYKKEKELEIVSKDFELLFGDKPQLLN